MIRTEIAMLRPVPFRVGQKVLVGQHRARVVSVDQLRGVAAVCPLPERWRWQWWWRNLLRWAIGALLLLVAMRYGTCVL